MKTYDVYYGDRCVGSVKAENAEHALREAAYKYRHWCGGYATGFTVREVT